MKKFVSLLIVIIFILTLTSCSEKKAYKSDVSVSALSDAAKNAIPLTDGYINNTDDADYMEFTFDDLPSPDEAIVFSAKNASSNINEVGIFKYNDYAANGKKAFDVIEKYIHDNAESKRSFIQSYAPDECEKLDSADCKAFGNYIVYTILTKQDSEKVFTAVENLLKVN